MTEQTLLIKEKQTLFCSWTAESSIFSCIRTRKQFWAPGTGGYTAAGSSLYMCCISLDCTVDDQCELLAPNKKFGPNWQFCFSRLNGCWFYCLTFTQSKPITDVNIIVINNRLFFWVSFTHLCYLEKTLSMQYHQWPAGYNLPLRIQNTFIKYLAGVFSLMSFCCHSSNLLPLLFFTLQQCF